MQKIKQQAVPAHKSETGELPEKVFFAHFFTSHLPAEITQPVSENPR